MSGAWPRPRHRHSGVAVSASAADDDRQYGVKANDAVTGSLIKTNEIHGSKIPVNKRWDQLTAEERQRVVDRYEHVAPGDEPPFPADGIAPIDRAVLKVATKLRPQGDLYIAAIVEPAGDVSGVEVFKNPDDDITRAVAGILMQTRFKPAICGGQPCRMSYPFQFKFVTD